MPHTLISTLLSTILLFASLAGAAAHAQDDLAQLAGQIKREAEHRASYFRHNPTAPAAEMQPADSLLVDISEFALLTHRLSAQIERNGGPTDLKCIFKGMSEDSQARIDALDQARTRAEMARAFDEIVYLANQAETIANDPDAVSAGNSLPPQCQL